MARRAAPEAAKVPFPILKLREMSPTQDDTFKFLVTSHLTRTSLGSPFLASIEVRHGQRRAWAGASSDYYLARSHSLWGQ